MRSKPIPNSKRKVIVGYGLDRFKRFFSELTHDGQVDILRRCPKVPGFRPDSVAGNARKIESLFKDMQLAPGLKDSEGAWLVYRIALEHWVDAHVTLNEVLASFDNSADFVDSKDGQDPNTEVDIRCFELLARESAVRDLSREVIQEYYDFGYFLPDERIEAYIASAKSADELAHIRRMAALPVAVDTLQAKYDDLARQLDKLQTRLTHIEPLQHDVESTRKHVSANEARLDGYDRSLSRIEGHFKGFDARISGSATKQDVKAITLKLSALERSVKKLGDQVKEALSISSFDKEKKALRSQIEALTKGVNDVAASQRNERSAASEVALLEQHITALEQQGQSMETRLSLVEDALTSPTQSQPSADDLPSLEASESQPTSPYRAAPLIQITRVSPSSPTIDTWAGRDALLNGLQHNLVAAGLHKVAATVLAGEILAGLSGSRLVMFKGSFATIIAHVCAQTLASGSHFTLRIPVDLLSSVPLEEGLRPLQTGTAVHGNLTALAIEGLNRAAFEVYGDDIVAMVDAQLLGLATALDNLLVFGTLVEGPATLSLTPSLCELGPIFDLDTYRWQKDGAQGATRGGATPRVLWDNLTGASPRTTVPEDVSELRRACMPTSLRWRRAVDRAYNALRFFRPGDAESDRLASLAAAWIVPYVIARGMEWERLRAILRDHGLLIDQDEATQSVQGKRLLAVAGIQAAAP